MRLASCSGCKYVLLLCAPSMAHADHTGTCQADDSLATRQLAGRKQQNKERITVAVCCNGDGSHKPPLWIIGKYANPRSASRMSTGHTLDASVGAIPKFG